MDINSATNIINAFVWEGTIPVLNNKELRDFVRREAEAQLQFGYGLNTLRREKLALLMDYIDRLEKALQ